MARSKCPNKNVGILKRPSEASLVFCEIPGIYTLSFYRDMKGAPSEALQKLTVRLGGATMIKVVLEQAG